MNTFSQYTEAYSTIKAHMNPLHNLSHEVMLSLGPSFEVGMYGCRGTKHIVAVPGS